MDKVTFDAEFIKFIKAVKSEFDINFQKKLNGIIGNSMIRGNNPSLSHIVEDKFAEFLFTIYSNKNYLYLIDVNLSTCFNGEGKSIRPDIVVLERKSNEIKAIFELKIDDARAEDDWVAMSQARLDRLKKISKKNELGEKGNYIHYNTIKVNDIGEPIKTPSGKYSTQRHSVRCSPDAKSACITMCEENSRKIKDTKILRTSGDYAMYLSEKHFNNQNHSKECILSDENLKANELCELLLKMNL
jgi:hypothetical protein